MAPARVFALVATVGGLIALLALPPFEAPDEPAHFFRAYGVSQGVLVAARQEGRVGGFVPASLVPAVHLASGIPFHPDHKQDLRAVRARFADALAPGEQVFVDFPNSALVAPVCYLPQAAGLLAGRLLGVAPIALMYLGRLANLAAWIAVMALAIRATPVRKWLFAALALAPMSLQQAASLSADALTNAACFLFVALCLQARVAERPVSRREVSRLAAVALLVALCKFVYLLVPCAVFLIPTSRFGSAGRRWRACALVLAAACAGSILWDAAAVRAYTTYEDYDAAHRNAVALIPGVAPMRQVAVILHDPVRHARVVATSVAQSGRFLAASYVGLLGWGETRLRAGHVPAYLAFLVLLALVDEGRGESLATRERLLCATLALGSVALVATALYVQWTPVGRAAIDGLHGRYLVPLGPLAFLVLLNARFRVPAPALRAGAAVALSASVGLTIAALLDRYY